LSDLNEDLNRDLENRGCINEVCAFGWWPLSDTLDSSGGGLADESEARRGVAATLRGIWFADDGAVYDGRLISPDDEGVLWIEQAGYLMGKTDREGESFAHGRPRWQPKLGLQRCEDTGKYSLKEGPDDPVALTWLFRELSLCLSETVQDRMGSLILGAVLACAAAPEYFHKMKSFPGLMVAGEKGSGKSTLIGLVMQLFGLKLEGGIKLGNASKVGMQIAAQQYSSILLWLEEFQFDLPKEKVEMVKSLFNREPTIKKEFGEGRRRILTNAIVTGEASMQDGATRSRFPLVQLSERRMADHLGWFKENARFFFACGVICCCIARSSSRRFSRTGNGGVRVTP
jgi:hypothetical protein